MVYTDENGNETNDTDIDHDTLSAVLVSGPTAAQGTLSLHGDGSFTFTPAPNFNGTSTFTYTANDGSLNSNAATVAGASRRMRIRS